MLKLIRIILGILVIGLSGYGLITKDFQWMPYLMLLLGGSMLTSGLIELQKDRKGLFGYLNIIVSFFLFYVSIKGFIFI